MVLFVDKIILKVPIYVHNVNVNNTNMVTITKKKCGGNKVDASLALLFTYMILRSFFKLGKKK